MRERVRLDSHSRSLWRGCCCAVVTTPGLLISHWSSSSFAPVGPAPPPRQAGDIDQHGEWNPISGFGSALPSSKKLQQGVHLCCYEFLIVHQRRTEDDRAVWYHKAPEICAR